MGEEGAERQGGLDYELFALLRDDLRDVQVAAAGKRLDALYGEAASRLTAGADDPFTRRVLSDLEIVLDQLEVG